MLDVTSLMLLATLALPVFPGAEGFGTDTPAGRGGNVLIVTTLSDSGPGSLREAIGNPTPRTIVFEVGGTIELKDTLHIDYPFITIAGQTAPGDGILIRDNGFVISTHDVLIQHLRVRPGIGAPDPENNDAIAILGPDGGDTPGAHHVVLDHISASWGEDETISVWYGASDITISNSIISEALSLSRRGVGHSAGLLIGDSSDRVSIRGNLLAHNDFRNPLIKKGGTHDVIGNVIYDWGIEASVVVDIDSSSRVDFVDNIYISGISSGPEVKPIKVESLSPDPVRAGKTRPKLHLLENEIEEIIPLQIELVSFVIDPTTIPPGTPEEQIDWAEATFLSPVPFSIPATPINDVWTRVLMSAGATKPRRDPVDRRIVAQVITRQGRIIDSVDEVGGYPLMETGIPARDADRDGMPDHWENAHGHNPQIPDSNGDADADGYSNLEEYLHSRLVTVPEPPRLLGSAAAVMALSGLASARNRYQPLD